MTAGERRVVLITGCSTGIGAALAQAFHAHGDEVIATARKPESLAALADAGMHTLALDVNDPQSVEDATARALQLAGRVDVLVNNAGINLFGPLVELPLRELGAVLETNVVGVMAMTQALFPSMADRGSGLVVNIGSVVGVTPTPWAGIYCASKAAVHQLSSVLRMELAPFGIDVTVVQPGAVRSNIAQSAAPAIERFAAPPSRYHRAYAGLHARTHSSQDDPMEAEDFAAQVVERVSVESPPRTIVVGGDAQRVVKMRELPDDQLELIMGAHFGLGPDFEPESES